MHFVPYYPPERLGGVGEFAAALHEGLLRRGCESTVVTSGRGSSDSVQRIARTRLGWFLGTLRWTRRAAACDVVHCQSGEAQSGVDPHGLIRHGQELQGDAVDARVGQSDDAQLLHQPGLGRAHRATSTAVARSRAPARVHQAPIQPSGVACTCQPSP